MEIDLKTIMRTNHYGLTCYGENIKRPPVNATEPERIEYAKLAIMFLFNARPTISRSGVINSLRAWKAAELNIAMIKLQEEGLIGARREGAGKSKATIIYPK